MTGFDRLSYQSRWFHVAPERKFLFWLLLMGLAFTLPPLGQGIEMALIAALTCWLLRVSPWRWGRWMALPFGQLVVDHYRQQPFRDGDRNLRQAKNRHKLQARSDSARLRIREGDAQL